MRPRDSEMSKTQGLLTGRLQPRDPPHTCSKVSPGAEVWATVSEHRGGTAQRVPNARAEDEGSPLAEKGGKGIPRGGSRHRPEMWESMGHRDQHGLQSGSGQGLEIRLKSRKG